MTETLSAPTEFPLVEVAISGNRSVRVSGQRTASPHLAITPTVTLTDDGTPQLLGHVCTLIHIPTGRQITSDTTPSRLMDLAQRLTALDWDFHDPTAPTLSLQQAAAIVRDWRLNIAAGQPVLPERDEQAADHERIEHPALTLLIEHIRAWQDNAAQAYELIRQTFPDRAAHTELSATVAQELILEKLLASGWGYGLIYLMAVLYRLDPPVADHAARTLRRAWEDAEGMDENLADWLSELQNHSTITLPGIPQPSSEVLAVPGAADQRP